MNKKSRILILMMIVIIIIIALLVILLYLNSDKVKIEGYKEDLITLLTSKIYKIENKDQFFNIDSHIKKYVDYKKQGNTQAINSISSDNAIDGENFKSEEMYLLNRITNDTVYVYGKVTKGRIQTDTYIVVNLDYTNNTYAIQNSSKEEYDNAKSNIVNSKYEQDVSIQSNEYNDISLEETVNDLTVIRIYFDDYKFKAINKPEEAFNLLDAEYKKKKFDDNVNAYKQYVKDNANQIQDANIVKHGIATLENGNKQYIIIDNFDNYYKFTETGINQYIVVLDNYTLQTDEETKKYSKLSSQEKALSNVDKVMKLINEKNYSTVYNYLNSEFKNTYFPTLDRFTNYMKQNFFDNNIVGQMTVGNQGDNYIVTVPYKEFLSAAAEEKEVVFLVRLKEGTNFELSININ